MRSSLARLLAKCVFWPSTTTSGVSSGATITLSSFSDSAYIGPNVDSLPGSSLTSWSHSRCIGKAAAVVSS